MNFRLIFLLTYTFVIILSVFVSIYTGIVKWEVVYPLIIGVLIGSVLPAWTFLINSNTQLIKPSGHNFRLKKKPSNFQSEIVDKKYYYRGIDGVTFRSKFDGTLKNGYFVNEIFVPRVESQYQHIYNFPPFTPHVSEDLGSVKSYCLNTIGNPITRVGNLNGYTETGWKSWTWEIPQDVPLGDYQVKMMLISDGKELSEFTLEDRFTVLNPQAGSYNQSVNMG